jgi:hypothetical protein
VASVGVGGAGTRRGTERGGEMGVRERAVERKGKADRWDPPVSVLGGERRKLSCMWWTGAHGLGRKVVRAGRLAGLSPKRG